ncbi:hypothetical protein Hanom_Chr10g00949101 [Helianthus anomalus]
MSKKKSTRLMIISHSSRYCLRHFISNFNDKFRKSQLKALAYRVGVTKRVDFLHVFF